MGADGSRSASPRASVRVRIGVAFLLLALVLFGATGLLSADAARRQAEADTNAALQALAERLALQLDADMAARYQQLAQLASLPALLDIPPAAWRTLFEGLQASTPYSWMGLASPDGVVLAATGGLLQGQSVAQRPWFVRGRAGPVVGDVHDAVLLARLLPPLPGGEPQRFVDVAAPLRGPAGALRGVVGAHLGWQWAEERRRQALALAQGRPGVDIVLVDRAGSIVLGPAQPVAPGLARPGVQALRWSDGQDYLGAASPSRARDGYPGMGWTVVVRQPQALALAAADAVQHRVWGLGLLGAAIFGLVGWWLAGRLTAPLRRLAQQAQAAGGAAAAAGAPAAASAPTVAGAPTAAGALPGAAAPAAGDEVEQLAASLGTLLAGLRTANETLESRVAARTAALQRANEDLRSFARSVSHDLRGPLGAIAMLLRQLLARDASLDAGARRTLDVAATEAERLRLLADELLTLAMVEQRALQAAPVAHAALVQEVLQTLPGATPGTVTVGPLPTLTGDALMLRQVWTNLLSNALKFSSKTAVPHVEVRAHAAGDEIVFEVADNGAGFDPGQSDRLFGVFQRLHPPSQFPGTGVGLSIVRRVVHRHGGRVWAESAPGEGAHFYFALPGSGLQA